QQRPSLGGLGPAHERVDRRLEVHDRARLGEPLAVAGVEDDAAARGHDHVFERRQVGDDVALALAKTSLALLLEDVADVDARSLLDFGVAVDELQPKQRREPPADGGLSGAHGTDQIAVSLPEHGATGY